MADLSIFRGLINGRGYYSRSINGQAGGVVTISNDEARFRQIALTGVVSGAPLINFPAAPGMEWIVDLTGLSSSDGGTTVTVAAGGTGFTAQMGRVHQVYARDVGMRDTVSFGSLTTGEIYADSYPTVQQAIDACPDGGTVILGARVYTIDAAAQYAWNQVRGAVSTPKHGLVVADKRVNITGQGVGTVLRAGAANVDVLTYYSSDGVGGETRASYCLVSNLRIDNPSAHSGCNGLVFDRGYRNRVHSLRIGTSGGTHFANGIRAVNSWDLNILDSYVYGCATGVDATAYYRDSDGQLADGTTNAYSGANGPSHGLTIQGAEISGGAFGVDLVEVQMASIHDTTIEGLSSAGVRARGAQGLNLSGIYWENTGAGAFDLDLAASPNAGALSCRMARVQNANRIRARNTRALTVDGFRELRGADGSVFDVDTTVTGVTLLGTWWTEDVTLAVPARAQIYQQFNRGLAGVVNSGRPQSTTYPLEEVGQNLIANLGFANSANATGWTFSNMAVQTTGAPFGLAYAAATTGATCTATAALVPAFTNDLRDRCVTLSCWIKAPNATWSGSLQALSDVNDSTQLDRTLFDGAWHYVSAILRIGPAATGISFRLNLFSNGDGGNALFAGPVLTLGHEPLGPAMEEHLRPPMLTARRMQIAPVNAAVVANTQFDPTLAGVFYISGSGGAITLNVAQTTLTNSAAWTDGMEVEFIGDDDTNTVTFTTAAATKLKLGAATRVLGLLDTVRLRYVKARDRWMEVSSQGA